MVALAVYAVDSEKMSKSLGNFFTIRDVIAKYHPQVLRWFLLNTQYRQAINYNLAALDEVRGVILLPLRPCPVLTPWLEHPALPYPAPPCPALPFNLTLPVNSPLPALLVMLPSLCLSII